jgi:hypothetical protein
MAKIILGKRPKNFKKIIEVDMLEGGKGTVEMSYKYKTRTEFGTFIDELFSDAGVKPESQNDSDVKFSLEEALKKTLDANADYIMKVADGWNLEEEFSRDTVAQLCDELPGVALQIIDSYRIAVTEGRLGN